MAEFYTSIQTAAVLGIHWNTLRAYVKRGLLTPIPKGRGNLYSSEQVEALLVLLKTMGKKPYAPRKGN